ncbi:ADP-ribosylglycohydrolase family protein [Undibacterium sp. CY18W]|uniref:ADP-ribosylglycohydrolase family protein n=1 Tax=Undibacterium hunanense TaxID=2762292 RepID=A0ABR6ZPD0_9BURK|nr:ADP-ribosylglycohydrolase family protein [Undibacterium hunanense]MBC3917697.1 ADP-ribosylglycohydrolase family protein [Undibacterium hunanense]
MNITLEQRYLGALAGLACGDAVGTTVEFSARGSFTPVTDMTGRGPFGLRAGEWTDDTSMALCLAESLLTKDGFDAKDQMGRYLNWWKWGYLSSTGICFDIGNTVRAALSRYASSGEAFCGVEHPSTAGNGSLMRLAPVAMFGYPDVQSAIHYAGESSRTTHAAPEAIQSCQLLATILCRLFDGGTKADLFSALPFKPTETKIIAISEGDFLQKRSAEIRGSGYSVESLEASLWCFMHTDNFKDAILTATNLGDDADTTAAITGQIAGAYYGVEDIPTTWLERLAMRDEILRMARELYLRFGSRKIA